MNIQNILADLGIQDHNPGVMIGAEAFGSGASIESHSPVDGKRIASLSTATADDYERVMDAATEAFVEWRTWTAPQRGEVVRLYGEALRAKGKPRRPRVVRNGQELPRRIGRGAGDD